jgi:thiol-disulfide isomerase/thioredoxin
MELAWKRQQERDEMLKHGAVSGKVLEIQDLQHLESVVEKAGSSLLVVFFYTRSCGVCKELLRDFQQLCDEAKSQQIRAVFASHNLLDDFDYWSDISVWHKIRVPPTIFFYDEGAVVKKMTMHDVRRMGENYSSLRATMQQDLQNMKTAFRQTVFEKAPGARS